MMPRGVARGVVLAGAAALAAGAGARMPEDSGDRALQPDDLQALAWRSIGPANMSGRVADIALAPGDSGTWLVGYGTGGLWKTTNHGTTFAPIFDDHETSSIGSVAVCDAPPDWPGWAAEKPADEAGGDGQDKGEDKGKAKIVWVGTGEGNGRNSSSWGHGVYRSTDGGGSFEYVGLAETHDIPALAVDPRNPDVCYVAALGHLWGDNPQRGVYRTTDGGGTWEAVLQIDPGTGAVDVAIDPAHPDTLYAAMYHRRRSPWSFESGGKEGGIYRSLDGGRSWTKLTGGLPESTGRIGLDVFHDDPRIVMALIESDEGGRVGHPFTNRHRAGGVYRSQDGGETWQRTSDFNPRPFYFSAIRIDPHDDRRVYLGGWGFYTSDDGGRTFRGAKQVPHVDYHAIVIDPDDTDHLLIGTDGGPYESWDRGKTWAFFDTMAVGQFYNVAVDDSDPYRVGGGLQDNGTWIGPSETITETTDNEMGRDGAITNCDWRFIWGGDGFHVAFDPRDPDIVYAESQGGYLGRVHLDTGKHQTLRPVPKEGQHRFRFNWNAPFFISPHDPAVLYLGGNYVFRLTDRGDRWQRVSDDLSRRDLDKILAVGSDAETAGTVVALAESPLEAGLLWAGTDDGLVHVAARLAGGDGGGDWTDVTPEAVSGLYVAAIEPSHHDAHTAYAAVDGHRSDVFDPILLATSDLGRTWRSIAGDLPGGAPPKVIREDLVNPDVLYAGTERGAWLTIDRGAHWVRLNGKTLPTVPVDDLVIQPRRGDLVAGTHGRSIYILDDLSPLSQLTPDIVRTPFHVFEPRPARPHYRMENGALWSDRLFIADNPPKGAVIDYWLAQYTIEPVKIAVTTTGDDAGAGHEVRHLTGTGRPGLNRVVWDLQPEKEQRLGNPHELPEFVAPGRYRVTVSVGDDLKQSTILEVLPVPGGPP